MSSFASSRTSAASTGATAAPSANHRTTTTAATDAEGGGSTSTSTSTLLSSSESVVGMGSSSSTTGNELWFREEERWELTWPIWHMLPRQERKALALRHGYKTIGDFEEYMTLQRGLTDSAYLVTKNEYHNALAYPPVTNQNQQPQPHHHHHQQQQQQPLPLPNDLDSNRVGIVTKGEEEDDEDDGDAVSDSDEKRLLETDDHNNNNNSNTTRPDDDWRKVVGDSVLLQLLSEEMLHRVFEWLPVDAYATLALVSPHWKSLTRTEPVYKRLCERLYLNQSKKRQLHVGRFGNSYRTMLEKRPRVRAGGGVYVMKYTKVKPIQRDMWTEIPLGAVLEMVYYRYIYFQEDGRVLYALTPNPPHEMIRKFWKVCLNHHQHHSHNHQQPFEDDCIVQGTYHVQKCGVQVHAKQAWQYVRLDLTIQPEYQYHGRWGYLSFDRHMSSRSNNFEEWSSDRVNYEVPEEPFRFVRDKRL